MTRAKISAGEELFYTILFDKRHVAQPYASYRRLQEIAPVLVTSNRTVVLSRYEDVDAALRHRSLGKAGEGSFRRAETSEEGSKVDRSRKTMLFSNPPDHTRLRRLVSSAFTGRHVERLRVKIGGRVDSLLDRFAGSKSTNFITAVALPLPVAVISDLLGVPEADREEMTPYIGDLAATLEPFADKKAFQRSDAAEAWLAEYFQELLEAKRRSPEDDLLSRLAASHADDKLDDVEMISTAILLFGAGFENSVNLLGNGLHALLTHPAQLARLRSDPDLLPSAVEEMLRYDAPVQLDARSVLQPCVLADTELAAGTVVLTLLGAANRDPGRFPDADRFDIGRDQGSSLAFGAGIHYCLGAHLARVEAAELFGRMLSRFPRLGLAGEPERRPGLNLRGFSSLPVIAR